ncbi:MAG TPA: hypothetical protein VFH51_15780 [Myxococcota bacterium]|nr:hypothetical protein [Myxococcota bacterium]
MKRIAAGLSRSRCPRRGVNPRRRPRVRVPALDELTLPEAARQSLMRLPAFRLTYEMASEEARHFFAAVVAEAYGTPRSALH